MNLPSEKIPIVVWGNGACSANGTYAQNFLKEIASQGILVIANGAPNGSGTESWPWLTQAIDWAFAQNSSRRARSTTRSTPARSASPAGRAAASRRTPPRATPASRTTGIFSSGLLNDADDYQLRRLTHPIVYVIGGTSDIAYPNAIDDWGKLPSGLPAFMGNLNVGHGGTYTATNGGEFGRVASAVVPVAAEERHRGRARVRRPELRPVRHAVAGPAEEPDARRPRPRPDAHPDTDADRDADAHADAHPDADTHLRPAPPAAAPRTPSDQWSGGFVANVTVTARSAVNGWTVTVNLPDGATVTQSWNGVLTGTRGSISVANAAWNGRLGAGQSTTFGFQGTGTGAGATTSCQGL